MAAPAYQPGLDQVAPGIFAYFQPDGGWSCSNAGLIVDGEISLLVDTLFDERLTTTMLNQMRQATGLAPDQITTLVNTHADGDHTFGNRLVSKAEVIASENAAREMRFVTPASVADLMARAPTLGIAGEYLLRVFGQFDTTRMGQRLPTRTFTGNLSLKVGDTAVHLMQIGPAHTQGDTLVYVPSRRTIFTGDILFIDTMPVIWAGPIGNWIEACNRILELDAEMIIPGHGPRTTKTGVHKVKEYLEYIAREARTRFLAGMPVDEAARDIALGEYGSWRDAERIVVNMHTLYREFRGDTSPPDVIEMMTLMAKLAQDRRQR